MSPDILHALLTEQLTTLLSSSAPPSPEVEAELERIVHELLELEKQWVK